MGILKALMSAASTTRGLAEKEMQGLTGDVESGAQRIQEVVTNLTGKLSDFLRKDAATQAANDTVHTPSAKLGLNAMPPDARPTFDNYLANNSSPTQWRDTVGARGHTESQR